MIDAILDWFFPRKCLGCGDSGGYICEDCFAQISLLKMQSCPNCRKLNDDGCFCSSRCQKDFYIDQLLVCMKYQNGQLVSKMIKQLKYKFSEELVMILGRLLKFRLAEFSHRLRMEGEVIIVPVPLSRARLNYRGFNQSLLLAEYLSSKFSVMPVFDCLERKSSDMQQAKSRRAVRLVNLQNTIFCKEQMDGDLRDKVVVLIDDIATTGATMNECARVLKAAGAKYVCGLVLARGNLKWQT